MSTSTINSKKNIKTKESLNEDVSNIIVQEDEEIPQDEEQEDFRDQFDYQQEQMDDNQENYDLYNNACSGAQYQDEMIERNPQKYAYYPSCWTKKIQPAGKFTQV